MTLLPALLLAVSCADAPRYERPVVAMPALWGQPVPSAVAPLGADWWRLFADPELDALIAQAIAANQDLGAAVARLAAARAEAGSSASARFPDLAAEAAYTRERLSANAQDTPAAAEGGGLELERSGHRLALELNFELDVWGRLRHAADAAERDAAASAADLAVVLLGLTAELAARYAELRRCDAELALWTRTLALHRDAAELQEMRQRAGLDDGIPLARTEQALAEASAAAEQVRRQRTRAEHALAQLCGQPATSFTVAVSDADLTMPGIPVGLPATLLERRPDLAAAESRLQAACARVGAARAARLPAFALTGIAGRSSAELGDLLAWPSRIWAILPTVRLPILDGGRRKAEQRAAEARYEEAAAAYRAAVLLALREVEDALDATGGLAAERADRDRAAAAARDRAAWTAQRHAQGLTDFLDVIAAEQATLAAARSVVQVSEQQAAAAIQLARALGGGWQDDRDPVP